MSQPARYLFFSGVLCVASSFAAGQTTYKCGNSYSETPCVDGKAVAAGDKRTDEQKREADETTSRQKKAAGQFETDRIAQEKREAKALREADAAVIVEKPKPEARKLSKLTLLKPPKPPKPPKPVKAAKKKKAAKPAAQS
jgi:hypothetical protein